MVLGRAATVASAAAVLAAISVFFRRLSGRAYDGLSNIVSFSSKMIAGEDTRHSRLPPHQLAPACCSVRSMCLHDNSDSRRNLMRRSSLARMSSCRTASEARRSFCQLMSTVVGHLGIITPYQFSLASHTYISTPPAGHAGCRALALQRIHLRRAENGNASMSHPVYSQPCAASRAVETGEEHPLVVDPLAEGMAGEAAIATSRRRAVPAPQGSERKFKVGMRRMSCTPCTAVPYQLPAWAPTGCGACAAPCPLLRCLRQVWTAVLP